MTSARERGPWGWPVALAGVGLGLVHGAVLYGAAGRDDAYITYWVAERLVATGHLVNINGDAVEQSSSLLHVLLLAGCFALTRIPLPTLGLLVSAAAGAVAALVAWREALRMKLPYAGVVPFYLALFPFTAYWSFGGLEASLQALLVLLSAGAAARFLNSSSGGAAPAVLALGALVLARPEAIFVIETAFALAAVLLAAGRLARPSGRVLLLGGASAAIFAAACLLRWGLFGQIFPQPVQAKTGLGAAPPVAAGLAYLSEGPGALSLALLAVLALAALLAALREESAPRAGLGAATRIELIVLMSFVGAQVAFVVACGGDWMEGGRFLVPVVAPLLLGGLCALALMRRRPAVAVLVLLVAAAGLDLYGFQSRSMGTPIWRGTDYAQRVLEDFAVPRGEFSHSELINRVHLRDIPMVVALSSVVGQLERAGVRPVSVFSIQMGFVPFHVAGEWGDAVRFVDIAGLVTRDFADCDVTAKVPTSTFGSVVPYFVFFRQEAAIRRRCGIARPDVIFDLGPNYWGSPRAQAVREGYRVVFAASGDLPSRGLGRVGGEQFIAVRPELAQSISLPRPAYEWP